LSEIDIRKAFGSVWWRFLEFEISRSRMMSEVAGNPVSALILQVVAYHNLTVVQSGLNEKSYKVIRDHWEAGGEDTKTKIPLKLSYAAISDMTGIDKETERRSVRRLAEQGWVVIDQKTGIHYQPSLPNQDKLLMLNEWELAHLGRLMERLKDG
jgi:hypothetical protein